MSSSQSVQAWNRIAQTYFSPEDREMVEWAIGSALAGGPKFAMVIKGDPATGKSTVLKIIESIFKDTHTPEVATRHDGLTDYRDDAHMFAATVTTARKPRGSNPMLRVEVTGKTLTPNQHALSLGFITQDTATLADYFLEKYTELGPHYINKENI